VFITDGRVTVDGRTSVLGDRVHAGQRVELDGVPVSADGELVYYVLNKPVGVVTTASDPQHRSTVVQLVPDAPRVFPVGRLDVDTSGLLVLTNDGTLTDLLTHPRHGVEKVYVAEVDGTPSRAALATLRAGVELDDGPTAPARCRVLSTDNSSSNSTDGRRALVEIVIHEGRKRQVRRMCAAIGHPVRSLARTRIGPLHDSRLAPGTWRALTAREVRGLYAAARAPQGNSHDTQR
jgi:23S rRNA pseudouridine2605 synthase